MDINLVRLILQWCDDAQSREMIESRAYTYDYFGAYEEISNVELDTIVQHINPLLKMCNCTIRISWSMGEIIPIRDIRMINLIDKKE